MAPKRRTPRTPTNNVSKNKKQKQVEVEPERDELTCKIEELVAALNNEEYEIPGPESNRKMLVAIVEKTLIVMKEERHPWQEKMVNCVAEAILGIRSGLDAKVMSIQHLLDTNESTSQELENVRIAAESDLGQKDENLKAAQELQATRVDALKEAKKIMEQVARVEAGMCDDREMKQERQEILRVAYEEQFKVLMEGVVEEPQSLIEALQEVLESMDLEESLMVCAPKALARPVSARGPFDMMSLTSIDACFKTQMADITNFIANFETNLANQKALVVEKTAAWEEATAIREASKVQVEECKAAKTAANQSLKAAEKAIKEHTKSIACAADDMQEAQHDVQEFQKIQDIFSWLDNRCPEPEVPEVVPDEQVIESIENEQPAQPVAEMVQPVDEQMSVEEQKPIDDSIEGVVFTPLELEAM